MLAPCFRLQFDLFLPSLSHATFPTHDTVDKDTVEMDKDTVEMDKNTVEMDMVAMDMTDMDMDVVDMDLVVLGNTTGPLVHYWVRNTKCT